MVTTWSLVCTICYTRATYTSQNTVLAINVSYRIFLNVLTNFGVITGTTTHLSGCTDCTKWWNPISAEEFFCNWLYFSVCGSSIYTSKFVAQLTFTSPLRLLGNYHISILLRTPGSLFVSSLCFAPAPSFVSNFFVAEVIKLATIAGSNAPYI